MRTPPATRCETRTTGGVSVGLRGEILTRTRRTGGVWSRAPSPEADLRLTPAPPCAPPSWSTCCSSYTPSERAFRPDAQGRRQVCGRGDGRSRAGRSAKSAPIRWRGGDRMASLARKGAGGYWCIRDPYRDPRTGQRRKRSTLTGTTDDQVPTRCVGPWSAVRTLVPWRRRTPGT